MARRRRRSLVLFTLSVVLLPLIGNDKSQHLVPGQIAPPIVASKWLRGTPVTQFEPGQVYVVELWASWCVPCLNSLPGIMALESKYAGQITVIAADVWEFKYREPPTVLASYGDILPGIVALDSIPPGKNAMEGVIARSYLGTSGNAAVPQAYIIDGAGRIAWLGHPEDIEGPLLRVLTPPAGAAVPSAS